MDANGDNEITCPPDDKEEIEPSNTESENNTVSAIPAYPHNEEEANVSNSENTNLDADSCDLSVASVIDTFDQTTAASEQDLYDVAMDQLNNNSEKSQMDKSPTALSESLSSASANLRALLPPLLDTSDIIATATAVAEVPVLPPPAAVQTPVKRRPGRPPGSTRKCKVIIPGEGKKRDNNAVTDFTLRKFFEAGGRDYNEYLEWLKRKTPDRSQFIAKPTAVPFANFPVCGPNPIMQQMVATRLPYPHRPTAVMSPTSPLVGLTPQAYQTLIGSPVSPAIQTTLDSNSPLTAYTNMLSPNQPSAKGTEVLDLSAKRRSAAAKKRFGTEPVTKKARRDATSNTRDELRRSSGETPASGDLTPSGVVKVESSTDSDIRTWDVNHVVRFVASVPGCEDYAELFRDHRIDGATLPHLSEGHLLNVVKMKLGPAIRLLIAVQNIQTAVS